MAFKGYLLKFGDVEFPMDCLVTSSYASVPAKHTILDDWPDADNTRHLDVHPNHKAYVTVDTEDYLDFPTKQKIQAAFRAGLINETEQRYNVEFWDDTKNDYVTAEMHMNDIEYVILSIWDSGPVYDAIHIELEEF